VDTWATGGLGGSGGGLGGKSRPGGWRGCSCQRSQVASSFVVEYSHSGMSCERVPSGWAPSVVLVFRPFTVEVLGLLGTTNRPQNELTPRNLSFGWMLVPTYVPVTRCVVCDAVLVLLATIIPACSLEHPRECGFGFSTLVEALSQ